MNWSIIFFIAGISLAFGGILVYNWILLLLMRAQDKSTRNLKVGDIVYYYGKEAEVVDVENGEGVFVVIKTRVSRMQLSPKRSKKKK